MNKYTLCLAVFIIALSQLPVIHCKGCSTNDECDIDEKCVSGRCELDMKLVGEACLTTDQCSLCCTQEYKCKKPDERIPCKDDLDKVGLAISLVLAALAAVGTIGGAVYWAKRYNMSA